MVQERDGNVIYKLCDFEDSIVVNKHNIETLPITTF